MKTFSNTPGQGVRFAAVLPVNAADSLTNLYVAGSNEGYLLVGEIDQNGNFDWFRRINAKDTSLIINQMILDSDGNLVMVGTAIAGELGKAFILKFDPIGKSVVWFRRCTSNTFFWDVEEMGPDGDYLVGGQETYNGTGTGTDDITLKFKRVSGAVSVITNLDKNMNESVEALVFDDATDMIYTTGRYEFAAGVSKFRIGLNKVQTDGTVNWTRGYVKNTSTSGRFYSEDMVKSGDNLIIVGAGDDGGTNSVRYLWFIKTDLNGEALLTKKMDVIGASSDGLIAGIKPYGDGFILYGSLYNGSKFTDAFLISVTSDGDVNWSKSYPFRLRTPTTGLYCAGAMNVVGDNIFVVGEKLTDGGDLEGVLMSVSAVDGELNTCDQDFSISITSLTNFDEYYTLDTASVILSFPNSFPGVKPITLTESSSCNDAELVTDQDLRAQDRELSDILIYPDPAVDHVYVKYAGLPVDGFDFVILNAAGQVVKTGASEGDSVEFSIAGWASGIYFIQLVHDGTTCGPAKFIVQ